MRTSRGAPDAAGISVVGLGTVRARRADRADADIRRFRQNIYLETLGSERRGGRVGRTVARLRGRRTGGIGAAAAPDHRCMMVNLSPGARRTRPSCARSPGQRDNCLGLYASVEALGTVRVMTGPHWSDLDVALDRARARHPSCHPEPSEPALPLSSGTERACERRRDLGACMLVTVRSLLRRDDNRGLPGFDQGSG